MVGTVDNIDAPQIIIDRDTRWILQLIALPNGKAHCAARVVSEHFLQLGVRHIDRTVTGNRNIQRNLEFSPSLLTYIRHFSCCDINDEYPCLSAVSHIYDRTARENAVGLHHTLQSRRSEDRIEKALIPEIRLAAIHADEGYSWRFRRRRPDRKTFSYR